MTKEPQKWAVAPVLCVKESKSIIDYLVDRLGFTLQGSVGDPPAWASLCRNNVELMVVAGDHPDPPQDWAAYFYVDNADELHAEIAGRGAEIVRGPVNEFYGNREVEARLPDGRRIVFAGPV